MFPCLDALNFLGEDVSAHKVGYAVLGSYLHIKPILSGNSLMDPHEVDPMRSAHMS